MVIGHGDRSSKLGQVEVREILKRVFDYISPSGKRILFIVPDGTRTIPLPMMYRLFSELLGGRVETLDFLIALGTHSSMSRDKIKQHFGIKDIEGLAQHTSIFSHHWDMPQELKLIGHINKQEVEEITNGLLHSDIPVTINKKIYDYDLVAVCGTVFPHEVAGFSGGDKYFFPGISGPEVINFTHWLGALKTSLKIIGKPHTEVREIIEKAASFITVPRLYFNLVVDEKDLIGLFVGDDKESWLQAVLLSREVNIEYVDRRYSRVLSIMPKIYDDIWTAAKGMYKVEPVVSDGGEVVIYAPHIDEISYTHGEIIEEIGYHVVDYFVEQWDKYRKFPWSVLGHSTHLRGSGAFDPDTGEETPRIKVTLATGVSQETCEKVNLGYMSPKDINTSEWEEESDILLVPSAGEKLYRLREK